MRLSEIWLLIQLASEGISTLEGSWAGVNWCWLLKNLHLLERTINFDWLYSSTEATRSVWKTINSEGIISTQSWCWRFYPYRCVSICLYVCVWVLLKEKGKHWMLIHLIIQTSPCVFYSLHLLSSSYFWMLWNLTCLAKLYFLFNIPSAPNTVKGSGINFWPIAIYFSIFM